MSSPARDPETEPRASLGSDPDQAPIPMPAHSTASRPPKPNGQEKPDDKSAAPSDSTDKAALEEHASRKREREGSLEPSAHQTASLPGTPDALPLKKNRLYSDQIQEKAEDDEEEDPSSKPTEAKKGQHAETENVRKKVQDLTWKEGQEKPSADDSDKDVGTQSAALSTEAQKDSKQDSIAFQSSEKPTETTKATPVRTQPTFSSFSAKASPFSAVPTSSGTSSSSSKSGFGAFAAASSPFQTSSADSWLNKPAGGGIKPSSLGSAIGGKHEEPAPTSSSLPTVNKPSIKGPNLGFGAFAGASPLAKAKNGPSSPSSSASTPSKDEAAASPIAQTGSTEESFGEKLQNTPAFAESKAQSSQALEASEAEVVTGEEDEQSVYNVRAKLYTMVEDQSWKERGVGTIRINVPKEGKKSARLVMRADGVLRVILNVSLFSGMKCELAEKFVRIVAYEDGRPSHFAIKLSNPTNATAFMNAVQAQIAKLAK